MGLLEQSIVIDGCAFTEGEFPGYTPRMASGAVDAVFLTVPDSGQGFRAAATSIGRIHGRVDQQSDKLRIARAANDIEDAQAAGGTAIVLAFQDPAPIENRLDLLRVFYERNNACGQGLTIPNIYEPPCLAVIDHVRNPTGIRRYNRKAARESLQNDTRKVVHPRCINVNVILIVDVLNFRMVNHAIKLDACIKL